jgi:hypothetical protein
MSDPVFFWGGVVFFFLKSSVHYNLKNESESREIPNFEVAQEYTI